MEPKQLREMLKLHIAWLNNDPNGKRAEFHHINLNHINLDYADLRMASFYNVSLLGCSMKHARLKQARFVHVNMASANLHYADLEHTTINQTDFSHTEMSCANLQAATVEESTFFSTYMGSANLQFASLPNSDFCGAYLPNANLRHSDLRWLARGNMNEIKTASIDKWCIVYTANKLCIGCQSHLIAEWFSFDDDVINSMSPKALEWWHKWKPIIQSIIETSPAAPHAGMTTAKAEQHA